MAVRLRQVALVSSDLAAAERSIERDLELSLCFRDPGVGEFGLHNALYPIGDSLLEVVSPLPEATDTAAGRFLDRRDGDGGYMAIFETDEPVADIRARMQRLGIRVVFEARTPGATGLHLHPADVGGALVSIDRTDTWGEWPWAGPSWRDHRTATVHRLCGVRIGVADPAAAAQRWADALGAGTVTCHGPNATLDLEDGSFVAFVPAGPRGDGIDGVVALTTGEPRRATVAGCSVELVTALDPDVVFRAIERGDLDTVARLWADDIAVWHNTDGVTEDREANLATLAWFVGRTTVRDYRHIRRRTTTDGFAQQHVLHVELADGRSADLDVAMIVAVRAGKVRRIDEYLDANAVAAAFS